MKDLIKVKMKKKGRPSKMDKAAILILTRLANSPEFQAKVKAAYLDLLVNGKVDVEFHG